MNEQQLRQSLKNKGLTEDEIADAIDEWADEYNRRRAEIEHEMKRDDEEGEPA